MPKASVTHIITNPKQQKRIDDIRAKVFQAQCVARLANIAYRDGEDWSLEIAQAFQVVDDLLSSVGPNDDDDDEVVAESGRQAVQS